MFAMTHTHCTHGGGENIKFLCDYILTNLLSIRFVVACG